MVGIPRSKGCITCRRRKVGCDEGRPKCQRCVKSKRSCEGYESYPVFIQRTSHGLVARRHLEEVKPTTEINLNYGIHQTWENSVIHWFGSSQIATAYSWLHDAIEIPLPTAALYKSLLALSLTRFGRLSQNNDALLRGQRIYSESLLHVQKALYNPQLMWHDETLASVRVMTLYEMFETTSGNPDAWQAHLAGIAQLIEHRGPQRHRSPMVQAIFADMLKALMLRRASPFGKKEWHMDWNNHEQHLYDLGFDLAAFLERADRGIYDIDACNELHHAFGELGKQVLMPVILLNLLACKLLLGFVAAPVGLVWASESFAVAELMTEMLPAIATSSEGYRCIFPLTCLSWHYRGDQEKLEELANLRAYIRHRQQVRFASEQYEVQSLIPKVARDSN